MMPSKYDTNPLDPDFPEKAKAAAAVEETKTLPYRGGETQQFPADTAQADEQQTRKFAEAEVHAYSNTYTPPYTGQNVPAYYQQPYFTQQENPIKRKVKSIGLPENIAIAACYFPFYIGMVAGFILLLLTPKDEPKVRFHAAQGLGAHLGIVLISVMLGIVAGIAGGDLGTMLFRVASFVTLLIFSIRAFQGKPIHIAALDDMTNWLEEKLGPVK
jgi:uncharacterized membrane protein